MTMTGPSNYSNTNKSTFDHRNDYDCMIEKDCIDDYGGKNDDCDWSDVFDENQNDGPFCPSNQHANNDFLPLPLELLF